MSTNLEEVDEEFNNFMYRVTEVNEIVKKLGSKDNEMQRIGTLEADKYLKNSSEKVLANVDEKDIQLSVKSNRTVINRKALVDQDESEKSKESFMDEISKDADARYKDKMIRMEKMETLKKQATLAFRRGEFERALSCYNKAIEHIKDSPLLYNNRCLCYIKLQFYDKAIEDARTALKLNENCLRSHLFIAKAHHLNGNRKHYMETINEIKERFPDQEKIIEDFIDELTEADQFKV